jgi:hypothetical protein
METLSRLDGAVIFLRISEAAQNCKYYRQKAYQIKHGVKDDQIMR